MELYLIIIIIALILFTAYQYLQVKALKKENAKLQKNNKELRKIKEQNRKMYLNLLEKSKRLEHKLGIKDKTIATLETIVSNLRKQLKQTKGKVKSKQIYQLDENGRFIANFKSIHEASLKTNISRTSIRRSANQNVTVKGFKFKYKN